MSHRSFQVLRRGGKLISAVSRPDQQLAERYGVEAGFFLVDVTSQYLAKIARLLNDGKLRTHIGVVLPLADESRVRLSEQFLRIDKWSVCQG